MYKKLDNVHETGKEILAFLEEKEKAKLEGNLDSLIDIFNNYKYNLDNKLYKTNKHVQVQAIKGEAEQSIRLYRSQIERELSNQSFFHGDHGVEEKIKQLEKIFRNYQLALYIYSFAYFLEILLFDNFEKGYLESVLNTINSKSGEYSALYIKAKSIIEEYSQSSIQTYSVKAISGVSKKTGRVVSKIPLLNKTRLDENLITTGERLKQKSEERTEKVMKQIFTDDVEIIAPFIDNINTINLLYNEQIEILVDKEILYIKSK